jgi:hypothetical protein
MTLGDLITVVVLLIGIRFAWSLSITFSRPIYNKMSNVWEEDKSNRKMSNIFISIALICAFIIGYIL